jgi:hypothetical protein
LGATCVAVFQSVTSELLAVTPAVIGHFQDSDLSFLVTPES